MPFLYILILRHTGAVVRVGVGVEVGFFPGVAVGFFPPHAALYTLDLNVAFVALTTTSICSDPQVAVKLWLFPMMGVPS